jgi:uncharacterized YigZ family protein
MKKRYYDARHNCWCYIIKDGPVRYSDDGEPQGTAGQPMLNVFQREGVENVVCVVTRYFGGIKLGTGGLVKAYTEAAQLALENAPVRELQFMSHINFALSYPLLESARKRLDELNFECFSENYAGNVEFSGRMPAENFPLWEAFLRDLSKGTLSVQLTAELLE